MTDKTRIPEPVEDARPLVERLRSIWQHVGLTIHAGDAATAKEAADEIERLRAALTEIAREERLGPYTTAIIHCSSARDVARAALGGLPWTAK